MFCLPFSFFSSTFVIGFNIIISLLPVISIMNVRIIGVIARLHIITVTPLPTVMFLLLPRSLIDILSKSIPQGIHFWGYAMPCRQVSDY